MRKYSWLLQTLIFLPPPVRPLETAKQGNSCIFSPFFCTKKEKITFNKSTLCLDTIGKRHENGLSNSTPLFNFTGLNGQSFSEFNGMKRLDMKSSNFQAVPFSRLSKYCYIVIYELKLFRLLCKLA